MDVNNGAVGYTLNGGDIPQTNRFQTVVSWQSLDSAVQNGDDLNDTIESDTAADGESDPPFSDGGIAIRDTLRSLQPNATGTLTVGLFVGPGAPLFTNITEAETNGSPDVVEGGANDTYDVVLTSAPSDNVTISIAG